MLFNSIDFLIFFPIVTLIYFLVPYKVKHIWLLLSSYYFYMGWNPKYAILIFTSTVITYLSGILIEKNRSKLWVVLSFAANLGILFFFKYTNFLIDNVNKIAGKMGVGLSVPVLDIILPVGISFYTFQALSYTVDVYRGEVKAQKNFFKYALFVSFFPQLVAGPIERSKNLLQQIDENHKFDFDRAMEGVLLMLWGLFLKLVLGDRIAIYVDGVFNNIDTYNGIYLAIAAFLFAFQIYCDFAGYSTIALGAAKVMGFTLTDNFNAPYLSETVSEFWRRWHVSLTEWFKEYLYIPLGGNKKGKVRKWFNVMVVFLLSGLWHGASWHFVIWGGLNGLYQVLGEMLLPVRNKIGGIFKNTAGAAINKVASVIGTFIAVDFAWIFFRANSIRDALFAIKSLFTGCEIFSAETIFEPGLDIKEMIVLLVGLLLLLVSDIVKRRGGTVRGIILEQKAGVKIATVVLSTLVLVIFGVWGSGYDAAAFIYFQF